MRTLFLGVGAPRRTRQDFEDLVSGRAEMRVPYWNRRLPHKLNTLGIELIERAKKIGFLDDGSRPAVRNAWFVWCEAENDPFVWIRPARDLWEVHMDLVAFYGTRPIPGHGEEVERICRHYSQRKTFLAGCFTQVYVECEDAPTVARLLVKVSVEKAEAAFGPRHEYGAQQAPQQTSHPDTDPVRPLPEHVRLPIPESANVLWIGRVG